MWNYESKRKIYEIKMFTIQVQKILKTDFSKTFSIFWKKTWKVYWHFLRNFLKNLTQKTRSSNNIKIWKEIDKIKK